MFSRGHFFLGLLMVGLQMSPAAAADTGHYSLHAMDIFILFFVMLGPLKLLGPYLQATRPLDRPALNALSFKVMAIAVVSVFSGGFLGRVLLNNWHIPVPILILAAAIIFFLVALNIVLSQYQRASTGSQSDPANPAKLAFPLVVPPYGLAAVIVLLTLSADQTRTLLVLVMLALIMLLDLLAMLMVRQIMRGVGPLILQVLGVVLGVLQVGLALQIGYLALKMLGLPTPPG